MASRDARGRFVSDDVAAAERVLEAAVREAVATLQRAPIPVKPMGWTAAAREIARYKAEQNLLHAAHAADLLLGRAS